MKFMYNISVCFLWISLIGSCNQNTIKINDYYPIANDNTWRYIAPEGWKDGDYISKIEEEPTRFITLFDSIKSADGEGFFRIEEGAKTFRHYDATKASKLLSVEENGILYHGETFSSDGSIAVFDEPFLWFSANEKIGNTISVKRDYTRFFKNGTQRRGKFILTQQITRKEAIIIPAGNFEDCLRVEFDTYWDLGEGMEAKSINVYHYAKNVGVVKASARFIMLKNGKEIINRLVEPEMKSYKLKGDSQMIEEPSVNSFSAPKVSNIERIKIATVVTQDVEATKRLYSDWLDYRIVEEGKLTSKIANSWGTPKMTDRRYALLQPESGDDVYLRVIEGTMPNDYKAMTTFGWNAIEIIVENPDVVYEKLIKSPFVHLDGPAFLGDDGLSTIRAVQFKGPSEEVFYFTTDTGNRSTSTLLTPRTPIDRPFIMVVGAPDARVSTDFYVDIFGAKEAFFIHSSVNLIASAQSLPKNYKFPLSLVRLGAFSNSIEIDGYSKIARERPTPEGELPPGVSITSFAINDLNLIDPKLFITSPIAISGVGYDGSRMATIIGSAGELIELIEEKD